MHLSWGVLQSLDVATATHQSSFQRVAALVGFVGQLHSALLANVTVDVEVFVHGDDSDGFFGTFDWRYTYNKQVKFNKHIN